MSSYLLSELSDKNSENPNPIIKGYLSKNDPFDFDELVFNPNDDDENRFYIRKLLSQFQKFKYVMEYKEDKTDNLETESYYLTRIKKVLYSLQQLNHFAYSKPLSEKVVFLLLQYGTMLIQLASYEVNSLFHKYYEIMQKEGDMEDYYHFHLYLYEEIFVFIDFIQKNRIAIMRSLYKYGQCFIIDEILKFPGNFYLIKAELKSFEVLDVSAINKFIQDLVSKSTYSKISNKILNYLSQLEFCKTLHDFLLKDDYMYQFTKEFTSFENLIEPLLILYTHDYDLFSNSPTYFRLFFLFFQYQSETENKKESKNDPKRKMRNIFDDFRYIIQELYHHLFFGDNNNKYNDPLNYNLYFSTKNRKNPTDVASSLYQYAKTSHMFSLAQIGVFSSNNNQEKTEQEKNTVEECYLSEDEESSEKKYKNKKKNKNKDENENKEQTKKTEQEKYTLEERYLSESEEYSKKESKNKKKDKGKNKDKNKTENNEKSENEKESESNEPTQKEEENKEDSENKESPQKEEENKEDSDSDNENKESPQKEEENKDSTNNNNNDNEEPKQKEDSENKEPPQKEENNNKQAENKESPNKKENKGNNNNNKGAVIKKSLQKEENKEDNFQDTKNVRYAFYPIAEVAFNLLYNQLYSWCIHVSETGDADHPIDYPDVLLKYIRHWTAHEYILYQQFGIKVREATQMAIRQNATSPTTVDDDSTDSSSDDDYIQYVLSSSNELTNEDDDPASKSKDNKSTKKEDQASKSKNNKSTKKEDQASKSKNNKSTKDDDDQASKSSDNESTKDDDDPKSKSQNNKSAKDDDDQASKSSDNESTKEDDEDTEEASKDEDSSAIEDNQAAEAEKTQNLTKNKKATGTNKMQKLNNNQKTSANNKSQKNKKVAELEKILNIKNKPKTSSNKETETNNDKTEDKVTNYIELMKTYRVIYHYVSFLTGIIQLKIKELDYKKGAHSFYFLNNSDNSKLKKKEEGIHPFLNFYQLYQLAQILGPEGINFIKKSIKSDIILSMKSLIDTFNLIVRIQKRKGENIQNIDLSKAKDIKLHADEIAEIFARIGNLSYLMELIKFVFQTYIRNYHPQLFIDMKCFLAKLKAYKYLDDDEIKESNHSYKFYKKYFKLIKYFDMKDDCGITKSLYKFFTDKNAINKMFPKKQNKNDNDNKNDFDDDDDIEMIQNETHISEFKDVAEKYIGLTWVAFQSKYYDDNDKSRISDLAVARGIDEFFSLIFCYNYKKKLNDNDDSNVIEPETSTTTKTTSKHEEKKETKSNSVDLTKYINEIHSEFIKIVNVKYNDNDDVNNSDKKKNEYIDRHKLIRFAELYLKESSYFHQDFALQNSAFTYRKRRRGTPVDYLLIDKVEWLDVIKKNLCNDQPKNKK